MMTNMNYLIVGALMTLTLVGCPDEIPQQPQITFGPNMGADTEGPPPTCTSDMECDDGDACNGVETCGSLGCTPGTKLECDDGLWCNGVETCDPTDGCIAGEPKCTHDFERCIEGETKAICGCGSDEHCDDGVPCTDQACNMFGECVFDNAEGYCLIGSNCWEDGEEDLSGCNVCDASTPNEWVPINEGKSCEDFHPCSTDPFCEAGTCVSKDQACDDANPCTDDVCDPWVGCMFTPNNLECNDGDVCTVGDMCKQGNCTAGNALECNDGAECATVTCDPTEGCTYDAVDSNCNDGDACNGIETCDVTEGCQTGETLVCDDDLPCNGVETCNPTSGCIVGTPPAGNCCETHEECEDGNACNGIFICFEGTCTIKNDPLVCDDGNACNGIEICAPTGGCASTTPTVCDDGNLCTVDSCDDETGACSFTFAPGTPCDDGNVCTSDDVCENFKCEGIKVDCSDGDICNGIEWCNTNSGCQFGANLPCDDNNVCNGKETCDATDGCLPGNEPLVCDDGNPCTIDSCDPTTGCISEMLPNMGCDDGNACTENDTCNAGTCSGTQILCDDNNVCTVDTCNAGECSFENASIPCSDGDSCTSDDACVNGTCIGIQKSCNDSNPCTDDMCVDNACVFTPNTNACNDGNACTETDTCNAGTCSGTMFLCNDGNACTEDSCDPELGCNFVNLNGPANGCGDGNPCAGTKACVEGSCQTVAVIDCDDNNPCTDDSCVAGVGCFNEPNSNSCEDGNTCTDNICSGGECVSTTNPCDDGNPCTIDSCDDGCVNTPLICDDGNECTDDACVGGACIFVSVPAPCDDGDECTTDDTCQNGECKGTSSDIDGDGFNDGPGETCDHEFTTISCELPPGHANIDGCQKVSCKLDGTYLFVDVGFNATQDNLEQWKACIGTDNDGDNVANVGSDDGSIGGGDCNSTDAEVTCECWPDTDGDGEGDCPPFGNSFVHQQTLPEYMK